MPKYGFSKNFNALLIAALMSAGVFCQSQALAQSVPINMVSTNGIIKGGTYENTAGQYTKFVNSNGLWLQKGSTINGFEVNSSGHQTGNGGSFWLSSPGGVVRVDGDINVRGLNAPISMPPGLGGNVKIDAAYLYQSGHIFANGQGAGGHVDINVNAATFAPGSVVDVSAAQHGPGGTITMNATGSIDVQRGASLIDEGKYTGLVNTDLIDISGGLVNNTGIIEANAAVNSGTGGVIHLTSAGTYNIQPSLDALYKTRVFTPCESKVLVRDLNELANEMRVIDTKNAIINTGEIGADGSLGTGATQHGGNGGSIVMEGLNIIINPVGYIHAFGGDGGAGGGNGGTFFAKADDFRHIGGINVQGGVATTQTGSVGGNGGVITVYANNFFGEDFSASGGESIAPQGSGGNGGVITLQASEPRPQNMLSSIARAAGGNGSGDPLSKGGAGGKITITNITVEPGAIVDSSPGRPQQ